MIERKVNKFSSTSNSAPAEFGDGKFLSDVSNLYVEDKEYAYVSSNSYHQKLK